MLENAIWGIGFILFGVIGVIFRNRFIEMTRESYTRIGLKPRERFLLFNELLVSAMAIIAGILFIAIEVF